MEEAWLWAWWFGLISFYLHILLKSGCIRAHPQRLKRD
jgi:hypothetical protein